MRPTKQQYENFLFQQPDPQPAKDAAAKTESRKFWAICVPLGALFAFIVTLITGSAGAFLPCWFVLSLVLWGITSETKETR